MIERNQFNVGDVKIGMSDLPVIIAGPCVIESENHTLLMAEQIQKIAGNHGFQIIFKSSYDKANRSSIHSYRGPGLDEGLRILDRVKRDMGLPVLTDIHSIEQIQPVSEVADMIQIPAFLCRQTDLYHEVGRYAIPVNVKKGQFMSPSDMLNVIEKARTCGIKALALTERGTTFGYNQLVVDFAGFAQIRDFGVPVIFDATHAIQQPGGGGTFTSGNRRNVRPLCRAATAVGCDGLFLEVHDVPDQARSDGANMITPDMLNSILIEVRAIHEALRE